MRLIVCSLSFAVLMTATPARAGNDDAVLVGNGAAMTGGAVTADVDDGSAFYYNPAGAAAVTTDTADITASAIGLRYYLAPELITSTDGGIGQGNTLEILSIPSAVSYVRPISDRLKIGLGIFVPQAYDSVLRSTVSSTTPTASSTVQLVSGNTASRYEVALGFGYAVSPTLRFGASLVVSYNSLFSNLSILGQVADTATMDDQVAAFHATTSYKLFDAGIRLGVQWEPVPQLSLGLAAWSPAVGVLGYTHVTSGSVYGAVGTMPEVEATAMDEDSFDGMFEAVDPMRIRFGAAYRLDRGRIAVDGDVFLPLKNDAFGIDEDVSWNVRAGGVIDVDPNVHVGIGAFTDRTGVRRGALQFFGGTVGLEMSTHHQLAGDDDEEAEEEPAHEIVLTTFIALRYAAGVGDVPGFRLDASTADLVAPTETQMVVHEVFLHLGSSMDF